MNRLLQKFRPFLAGLFAVSLMALAGCSTTSGGTSEGIKLKLTGDQEVPAVKTAASGTATVMISPDRSVSGTITTTGIEATAAHIHEGPAGKNGPVIVPFTKGADNTWAIAPGAKLTEAQYASYKAGNLYVNVHSAANKGGELRAQIKPAN